MPDETPVWATLTSEEKRARVLLVAGELFAREGTEFPMPALAEAVGVGVGTIYRQIGTKESVLAELVIQRLDRFQANFESAMDAPDPVEALLRVVRETLAETMQDRVAKISFEISLDNPDVREKRAIAAQALQRLVDDAVAAGGIRADATAMDLRMMFRLAREAEKLFPGGGARIAELVLAGLRTG